MKVLIVGLGSIARKHISALRKIDPSCKIEALRSSLHSKPEEGVGNIYTLDGKTDYDFAIVSNPTSLHAETVTRLSEFGMPLFIEKPLFSDSGHLELLEKIEKKEINTYVACNLRFLDSLRFVERHLKANPGVTVNEVNAYCGSYLPEWRPGSDFRKCYSALPELGGGVHIDLIHELDYVYWLFGRPARTYGTLRNVSSLGIKAVDYANYTLHYDGFTASVILNYYRRDYKRTLEILFSDKTWIVNLKDNTITDSSGEVVFKGKNSIASTYDSQMEYFIECLHNGNKPANDIRQAHEVLEICMNYERP